MKQLHHTTSSDQTELLFFRILNEEAKTVKLDSLFKRSQVSEGLTGEEGLGGSTLNEMEES